MSPTVGSRAKTSRFVVITLTSLSRCDDGGVVVPAVLRVHQPVVVALDCARKEDEQPPEDQALDPLDQRRNLHLLAEAEEAAGAEEADDVRRRRLLRRARPCTRSTSWSKNPRSSGWISFGDAKYASRYSWCAIHSSNEVVMSIVSHSCPACRVAVPNSGKLQAKASFVLRRVHGHPHSLGRREVLDPRQACESLVVRDEIVDTTHASRPSSGRSSSVKPTSVMPPLRRKSIRLRCEATEARSKRCDRGWSSTRAQNVSNSASPRTPSRWPSISA